MEPRVLRAFLSTEEADLLVKLEANLFFEPGRQETGYLKARVLDLPELKGMRERALSALGVATDWAHDCYLLRYPTGSLIPPHRDDAPTGSSHIRFNALVTPPEKGGNLFIDGHLIDLSRGDAVVFRPDLSLHAVTEIQAGTRLVWSVGTLA